MSQTTTEHRSQQTINAPFRVKSAGLSLIVILIIGAYYTSNMLAMLAGSEGTPDGALNLAITALVLFIVVEATLQIVLFIGAGRIEKRTQRDDIITARASRNAYIVLTVGVFATVAGMITGFSQFELVNVLLMAFLLAEIVKFGSQLLYYRRAA